MKRGYFKDLGGMIYGRLSVKSFSGYYHNPSGKRAAKWLCVCECGAEKEFIATNLTSGHATSCGCLRSEQKSKAWMEHGHASGKANGKRIRSSTYRSWLSMRERCLCENHEAFHLYGGRGIRICSRWDSFQSFLEDMGVRPKDLTLERIDTNGHYEPGNCRWATRREQGNNRRNNRLLEIHGETLTVSEWSDRTPVDARTIIHRLNRGWKCEAAVFAPAVAR